MNILPLTPAAVTAWSFALWAIAEGGVQLLGVRQPDAPDRQLAALTPLLVALYGCFGFGWLDAGVLQWTTLGVEWRWLRWVGVALTLVGFGLRLATRYAMRRHFSGYVQTTQGHRLVTTGLFAWMRHPIYLATLLLYVGMPLGFGSLGALGIGLGIGAPALWWRICIEEKSLAAWFGEEFTEYQRRTARLIPYVW
ncbi:methyltransferase family protein [Botrimarina mediterranea]|uniref:Isoprenylcysteine carboxyl methyltransferase (ICMT) family protein n=1 Tax=Botrimarina mediterranea TaxID=2528022 RepID=A0A518K4P6_9BACT|nr:isoprenylcysteine carboxylmethyltransferase family protein [Botrimarina mediterranea]QDV72768.1 Isoprenylcysteine carboxyl methyltransferase (ICMT) family protein [Botrimarina mediterranea]QDV77342.1 Isoprenylcysteine carboxyl methyltransferase (ICMT) family protein [Planctomycetes bacterium K2D]